MGNVLDRLHGLHISQLCVRNSSELNGMVPVSPRGPDVDRRAIENGCAEFIFRRLEGRRLEDRVLDVLRITRMACATQGIDSDQVSLAVQAECRAPDEFVIAQQLLSGKIFG